MSSDRPRDPKDPNHPDPLDPARGEEGRDAPEGLSRRSLFKWGAVAGAGASLGPWLGSQPARAQNLVPFLGPHEELEEATIADLQAAMESGDLSAVDLVDMYLDRIEAIDVDGPALNSIIEVNPDARRLAERADQQRAAGNVKGPLHGIPFVIKDNIDTGDEMQTAAGSLALVGTPAHRDARAVWKLRRAGAVLLGKCGLSEWANFRGFDSTSGWSGRGGQVRNPFILDRNPCGSSSGSAAAVSANLAAFALGSETDGSVVCPSSACGVVGIKPTIGVISRSGVVPIAHSQDTIGVHGRTVADAAAALGPMTGGDARDPATFASGGHVFDDYTQFLDPDGLAGTRIGVLRAGIIGFSTEAAIIYEQALADIEAAGATLVDPADPPTTDEFNNDSSEIIVLIYEFKRDLNAYLATRTGVPVSSLADVIQFNLDHADEELIYFGQEFLELAELEIFSEAEYMQALATGPRLAGPDGIDAALAANDLNALVAFTGSPAWPIDLVNGDHFLTASSHWAAVSGYANITVPGGFSFGLPVGINFIGGRWSEPTLIKLASGFEAATQHRLAPPFLPTHELPDGDLNLQARRQRLVNNFERLERLLRHRPLTSKVLAHRPRFL